MNIRRKYIRNLVESLLLETGQGSAPVDVRVIADRLNVIIREAPHDDDELSGFLLRDPSLSHSIIGVNKTHNPNRKRFTIAHELGHLMLHVFEQVHVDKVGYSTGYGRVRLRNTRSSEGVDAEEIEANFFAAELLMPKSMLEEDLRQYPELDVLDERAFSEVQRTLSKKYMVSSQALSIRLVQLGFLHVD